VRWWSVADRPHRIDLHPTHTSPPVTGRPRTMYFVHVLSWILFFFSAIFMTILILLQESKGGGLAEAFGGMGAETFGVKSGGINKVTFTLAAIFCGSALLITATWNS
jgi:preprotein translocase subunit SecG